MLLKGNIFPIFRNLSSVLVRVSMSQILISTTYDGTASFHSGTTNSVLLCYPQLLALCPVSNAVFHIAQWTIHHRMCQSWIEMQCLKFHPLDIFSHAWRKSFLPLKPYWETGSSQYFPVFKFCCIRREKEKRRRRQKKEPIVLFCLNFFPGDHFSR